MPVIEDIDVLKNAEQALRESETRMRALLDASQDEILLVSTDGTVLTINKAARARLAKRLANSDPIGAPLDQLLSMDLAKSRLTVVQRVAATATLAHLEQQIGARWFECWFYPVVRPDGGVSEVAVYAREISERKQSEANLRNLYQAIQHSPVSVMITDLKGRIEYVNPKLIEITGYTLAEIIGQNPRILKSGHTARQEYTHLWASITSGGVWRGEFHNRKKNGELFWESAVIAAVKDTEGKFSQFVAVKEDITERKATDELLRQAQKLQAVGQLTGGIAHDFNNLLAIIIGNLQLLQEHVGGDIKIGEFLTDALWSAQRGAELTYQLLAVARRQPLHPEALNLNDVVKGMSDLLRRTLGAGVDIHVDLAPDLWEAHADRGEVERALLNLAVNARDAMADGGALTLETGNAVLDAEYAERYPEVTAGDYVLFAVSDTGTGMPPEILERVLEPFFTTKAAGKGSGLGLSMVYGFVKQSEGHLSIHSDVGHGTTVKLYLPRAATAVFQRDEAVAEAARPRLCRQNCSVGRGRGQAHEDRGSHAGNVGVSSGDGRERHAGAPVPRAARTHRRAVHRSRPAGRHERSGAGRGGAPTASGCSHHLHHRLCQRRRSSQSISPGRDPADRQALLPKHAGPGIRGRAVQAKV